MRIWAFHFLIKSLQSGIPFVSGFEGEKLTLSQFSYELILEIDEISILDFQFEDIFLELRLSVHKVLDVFRDVAVRLKWLFLLWNFELLRVDILFFLGEDFFEFQVLLIKLNELSFYSWILSYKSWIDFFLCDSSSLRFFSFFS